jgi:LmbE family N-acetylglucosaminyl deacetylase
MKIKTTFLLGLLLILVSLSGCINGDTETDVYTTLLEDIENGKSIMMIEAHPNDEAYTAGIFAISGGHWGNKMWIVCVGSVENVPPENNRTARRETIAWFEDKYLEEYINFEYMKPFPFESDELRQNILDEIEEKKPDIILTFTPYGWRLVPEHINVTGLVTDIYDDLSYEPKVYWFLNAKQGPTFGDHYELDMYPPTDIIDLDIYSDVLNMTYWDAKVEVWDSHGNSQPGIDEFLYSQLFLENDKKEYFRRVE